MIKATGYVIIIGQYYDDHPMYFRSVNTLAEADTVMKEAGYTNRSKKRKHLRYKYLRYYENDTIGLWARVYKSVEVPS